MRPVPAIALLTVLILTGMLPGATIDVSTDAQFHAALRDAQSGTRIRIAPGTYAGGVHASGLAGTAERPIVIEGADPAKPPVFEGGAEAIHLTDPAHVTLRRLVVRGQTGNGINIDDGGSCDSPHHIIRDVGPTANHDALKMSGDDGAVARGNTIRRPAHFVFRILQETTAPGFVPCRNGRIEAT